LCLSLENFLVGATEIAEVSLEIGTETEAGISAIAGTKEGEIRGSELNQE